MSWRRSGSAGALLLQFAQQPGFANFQSRITVSGGTCGTSAASSVVRPPKKCSSDHRAQHFAGCVLTGFVSLFLVAISTVRKTVASVQLCGHLFAPEFAVRIRRANGTSFHTRRRLMGALVSKESLASLTPMFNNRSAAESASLLLVPALTERE